MHSFPSPSLPVAASTGPGLRRLTWASGALGVAWNLFGIVQWASSLRADADSLTAGGLTRAQADLILALPWWMDVAFAVGVFGGLAGSVALLRQHRFAPTVLGLSLAAYVVLFAGDAMLGLFAALPRQLPILSLVVFIAVALVAVAQRARAAGALR